MPLTARSLPFATADRDGAARRPGSPLPLHCRRRQASAVLLSTATLLTSLACARPGAPASGATPSGGAGDAGAAVGPGAPSQAIGGSGAGRATPEVWLDSALAQLQRLQPPFPGAVVEDARFLDDGGLALTVHFPPYPGREVWLFDLPPIAAPGVTGAGGAGGGGSLRRLGPLDAPLAISPAADGQRVAYLAAGAVTSRAATAPGTGPDSDGAATRDTAAPAALPVPTPPASVAAAGRGGSRLDEVWISPRSGQQGSRAFALPSEAASERLVDLSWAPDDRHLLVVSQSTLPGAGQRARLRWLDAGDPAQSTRGVPAGSTSPSTREVATLPVDVMPGSYAWSPTGDRVALLSRTGQVTSLGVVDTAPGAPSAFTYVADLDRSGAPSSLVRPGIQPPLAWAPDGQRLVFAAPPPERPGGVAALFGPARGAQASGLYVVDLPSGAGPLVRVRPIGLAGMAPTWRPDGSIVALAFDKRGAPPVLRRVDAGGRQFAGAALRGLPAAGAFSARWDSRRTQALLAVGPAGSISPSGGQVEYWLVRFSPGPTPAPPTATGTPAAGGSGRLSS